MQEYDAVIISSTLSTRISSVPTSQEPGANQPMRIIISRASNSTFNVPALASGSGSKLMIFSDRDTVQKMEPATNGIETVVLDQISINEIFEYCKHQGFCSVLVDLRGDIDDLEELLKEAIQQNALQKVVVEVLPFWDGRDVNGSTQLARIAKGLKAKNLKPKVVGQSIILEGYF